MPVPVCLLELARARAMESVGMECLGRDDMIQRVMLDGALVLVWLPGCNFWQEAPMHPLLHLSALTTQSDKRYQRFGWRCQLIFALFY